MSDSSKPRYRPPVRLVLGTPVHLLAFGGGAGLVPFAPGTFGTLVGIPLWLLLSWLPIGAYAAVTLLLFVLGCWICGRSASLLGVHDHPGIVFDEIVGFLLTTMPLLPALHWDRHVRGGFGIMLDDVAAAIPAAALLMIAERFV